MSIATKHNMIQRYNAALVLHDYEEAEYLAHQFFLHFGVRL